MNLHPQGLVGVVVLLGLAWLLSTAKRKIEWRVVLGGITLQFVLAAMVLKVSWAAQFFDGVARGVNKVISFADAGIVFVFGDKISDPSGPWGFIFAVRVLPVIVFFAALMAVLYHLRVMQVLVAGVAWILRKTLRVSGVEALSAAANVFVGQTEAPLTVRPYIGNMTRSQIMAIMTGGFATIAGSVLAAYVGILGGTDEESRVLFAKHLLAASLMSAPAGLLMAKIMLPETEPLPDEGLKSLLNTERTTRNVMDAAAEGATDGLKLALNVAGMLIAFVALLALLNWPLAAWSQTAGVAAWRAEHGLPVFTFQNILGMALKPLAWCVGIAWEDCSKFGSLMGTQVIATEFVAYLDLGRMGAAKEIDPRTAQIATYALCGFANLPSIAIQIGGLGALAPERRSDFAAVGLRAMTAGAFACWMTASVASIFI